MANKKLTRAVVTVGTVLEATANPGIGIQYRISRVIPISWSQTYIGYDLESVNTEKRHYRTNCTLNHLGTYFKLVPNG